MVGLMVPVEGLQGLSTAGGDVKRVDSALLREQAPPGGRLTETGLRGSCVRATIAGGLCWFWCQCWWAVLLVLVLVGCGGDGGLCWF